MGCTAALPCNAPEADFCMLDRTYQWDAVDRCHPFVLAAVPGTRGNPYDFGQDASRRRVNVADYAISRHTVTSALWTHIMGDDRLRDARGHSNLPIDHHGRMRNFRFRTGHPP